MRGQHRIRQARGTTSVRRLLPGLVLAAAAATLALLVNHWIDIASPLLIAILLGALLANTSRIADKARPGLAFCAKSLLRAGVALLGLQLVLTDIAELGGGMIAVVVVVVGGGIAGTLLVGRWLGVPAGQRLLIACGFSICGAAAVAAVEAVADVEDEEVASSIALVVVFGTLMIPLVPLAARVAGFTAEQAGGWAGGSIHEVAQVVAATGIIGGVALKVGVVVKLARVLLLAPVLAVIGLRSRRARTDRRIDSKPVPVVPLFVVLFVACAILRTTGVLGATVVDGAKLVQTALLTGAMFALGCGVHLGLFRTIGGKPVLLAVLSTALVAELALAGPLLALRSL